MRAAAFQRAAAVAGPHGAAVAALRAIIDYVPDGAARAAARLLVRELAAALGAGPKQGAQPGEGEAAGLARTRRRREQRRAALVRLLSSSAAVGDGLDACSETTKKVKDGSVEPKSGQAQELTTGERLAVGDAIIVEKDPGAGRDAGVRTGVSLSETESAGTLLQCQQLLQQQQPEAGAEAPAPAAMEMTTKTNDEQQASAAPRVAAAAAMPHKRQAVAAGTAVGVAVGEGGKEGGKPPAGGEGTWTTVMSRRARRQERARLEGTACAAARKAAAARAAAMRRRTGRRRSHRGVLLEYFGMGE